MHEKTLLYGALGLTAIGAVFAIARTRGGDTPATVEITPVSISDQKLLASAEIPIRLTSSDGTGLKLQSMRANAVVEDPLALTEMHLVFQNPESRVLEGTFRITLPQGASISRFAMKVNGAWQEGEVVEKQAARRAYEDFLHRKQDPALMEQGAGNEFSARVFPIPANGVKEIMIAYSEVVEAGAPYVLPLRGLPQLGFLDVDVHAAGSRNAEIGGKADATFSLHQRHFTPAADFVVEGKKLPRSAGLRSGELAIARVVPFAASRPEAVDSAVVLVDTSASRGLGLPEQARMVRSVLSKLPGGTQVVVGCFDQEVVSVYEGKAAGFGDKETDAIVARGALGASDFEQALGWATEQASRTKAKRVVLVGDGVATAGETDGQKLKEKVEKMRAAGVTRMDAIAAGGIRDDAFLRTIVRGVLDRDGVVLDAKLGADALARRLGEATSSGVPVKVAGASWSWPQTLDGLQSGDEVMVYARMDAGQPVKITVGNQELSPDLRSTDRPLVERAWAQAKIQSLLDAPTEDAATTKRQIISLSTDHRVLSPHTAMLVLETDFDYRRFNIDRNANLDILTVKDGRIAITHSPRSWEEKMRLAAQEKAKENEQRNKGEQKRSLGLGSRSASDSDDRPSDGLASAPQAVATATAPSVAAAPASPSPQPMASAASAPLTDEEPSGNGATRNRGGSAPAPGALDPSNPYNGDVLSGRGEGGGGQGIGAAAGDFGSAGAGAAGAAARPHARAVAPSHRAPSPAEPSLAEAPAPPPPSMPTPTTTPHAARRVAGPTGNVEIGRGSSTVPEPDEDRRAARYQVRTGALVVEGGLAESDVQRTVRSQSSALRQCYLQANRSNATLHGRMTLRVVVGSNGEVKNVQSSESPSEALSQCAIAAFKSTRFTAPGTGEGRFTQQIDFVDRVGSNGGNDSSIATNVPRSLPYEGRFKTVMERISQNDKEGALAEAKRWQGEQPGDIMALVALGEAYEARGEIKTAARAYGSILELFSFRADSRRFAGERLERLSDPVAIRLAADTYGKAAEQRPDHPASHRLYAFTLLKAGEHEKAFEAMKKGASRSYPAGRFAGVDRILKEDLGLIAAVWAAADPGKRDVIMTKLRAAGGTEETGASLRFVLNWETDANDVDFHIHDGKGGHAYYATRHLPSGGELYADVTTGYGPECFTIRGPREQRAYPYTLQAHYYSRGPMGYGMGKLQVVEHDGKGHLTYDERPFVVMVDRAYVDLGVVDRPKPSVTASLK